MGLRRRNSFLWAFPGSSDNKDSACNARDQGSVPGSGRSPGEGAFCPLFPQPGGSTAFVPRWRRTYFFPRCPLGAELEMSRPLHPLPLMSPRDWVSVSPGCPAVGFPWNQPHAGLPSCLTGPRTRKSIPSMFTSKGLSGASGTMTQMFLWQGLSTKLSHPFSGCDQGPLGFLQKQLLLSIQPESWVDIWRVDYS